MEKIFCIACRTETKTADVSGRCATCRAFKNKTVVPDDFSDFETEYATRCEEMLGTPYYGRWDELSVSDVKWLISINVKID